MGGSEFYQTSEEMNKKYDKTKFSRLMKDTVITVFENHRKSLTQDCERSELLLHFEWSKVTSKCQKWFNLVSFRKPEACGQTVLPDKSVLVGQKLMENAKFQMRHFD